MVDVIEAAEVAEVETLPPGVTLLELGPLSCRWPVDAAILNLRAPVTERYCGEPTREGSPYCPSCRKLAYLPRKAHTAAARPM
jgi:hypothetical protein